MPETIRLINNLELVLLLVVELDGVVTQAFTRDEREHRSIKPSDRGGKPCAGRLQVALHADLKLALGTQSSRVNDCIRDLLLRCLASSCKFSVTGTRPVAALAVNAAGELAILRGISVMAEEAAVIHDSGEVGRGRLIEPGTQIPALLLRVPGERQFREFADARAVKVSSRVIT